jgi:hypothetical protein
MEFIYKSDTTKKQNKKGRNHTQRMMQAVDFVGGTVGS